MAKFKCPYCGALSDQDGFCKQCDLARVEPYVERSAFKTKLLIVTLIIVDIFFALLFLLGGANNVFDYLMLFAFLDFFIFVLFLIISIVKRVPKKIPLWGMLACFLIFIGSAMAIPSENSQTTQPSVTLSKDEYLAQCLPADYKSVARNPDNYKNTKLTFSGKVVQVVEGSPLTIRINQKNDDDLFSSDIWLITYYPKSKESRILEDDEVVVYGKCTGVKTYSSIFGQQITVPSMTMEYYELVE